jgi:hypothetical protein
MVNGSLTDGVRLAMSLSFQLFSAARRPTRRRPSRVLQRLPGLDAAKIALFLLDPHPKMPDMGLSRTGAADLAAYIATLK